MTWIFCLQFLSHRSDIKLPERQHFVPELHLHELLWSGVKMLSLDKAGHEIGDHSKLLVMQFVDKGLATLEHYHILLEDVMDA